MRATAFFRFGVSVAALCAGTAGLAQQVGVIADGAIAGFAAAYFWSGMFFAAGAVISGVLFRTKADNARRAAARAASAGAGDIESAAEPVVAH